MVSRNDMGLVFSGPVDINRIIGHSGTKFKLHLLAGNPCQKRGKAPCISVKFLSSLLERVAYFEATLGPLWDQLQTWYAQNTGEAEVLRVAYRTLQI